MADGNGIRSRPDRDGAGAYIIRVHGHVARRWEPELRMHVTYALTTLGPISTLTGELPDQAALLGTLMRLAMLDYIIVLVRYDRSLGEEEGASDPAPPS